MLLHFLGQQLGILARMPDDEWTAKTRRERGRRILHSDFGAGNLGGVAADEVIHRLRRAQRTDRRQHTEGIGR